MSLSMTVGGVIKRNCTLSMGVQDEDKVSKQHEHVRKTNILLLYDLEREWEPFAPLTFVSLLYIV